MDKILSYIALGVAILAIAVAGFAMWSMNQTSKIMFRIVDELTETNKEKAEAGTTIVKNDLRAVKVERKRFRIFRRRQKFDSSINN